MKLKYYLRGMGIGIILTAIVMGFALGGRKATLSDAEIIQRAKALGMTEADTGTLTQSQEAKEGEESDKATSDQTLDQEGEEVSQEEYQGVASSDQSVSEVDQETEEGETKNSENESAAYQSGSDSGEDSSQEESDELASNVSSSAASSGSSIIDTKPIVESSAASQASTKSDSASDEDSSAAASEASSEETIPSKNVTIPSGMGSDQVAQVLYNAGFIDNASTFNRYLIDRKIDRYIRSGVKSIPDGATYEQIAEIITK